MSHLSCRTTQNWLLDKDLLSKIEDFNAFKIVQGIQRAALNRILSTTQLNRMLLEAYRKNGQISDECAGRLRKGKDCMEHKYERTYSEFFQRNYKMSINRIDKYPGGAYVYLNGCEEPVKYDRGSWWGSSNRINKKGLVAGNCKLEKTRGIRSETK